MTARPGDEPHVRSPIGRDQATRPPYAEIAVDARAKGRQGIFTYSAPTHLVLQPGHLVRVPFGRRTVHGIVVRLTNELHVEYTKPVLGLVYPHPLLEATRLKLAQWIADYYMAPLFDAVAPMLPPGLRSRSDPLVRSLPNGLEADGLPPEGERLLGYLRLRQRPLRLSSLTRALGPWVPNAARTLVEKGLLEEVFPETEVLPFRGQQVVRPTAGPKEMLALAETLKGAPKQAALARRLAESSATAYLASEIRNEFGPAALAALARRGYASILEIQTPTDSAPQPAPQIPLTPTSDQAAALSAINAAQDDAGRLPRTFLLQGVTGSGKTEVYLQAIGHCFRQGKRALVLVPELSLTPQTVARFEARFPGQVGVLHSGLTPNHYRQQWWNAHRGRSRVVIGSRGSIFAPVPDLGLIVLDEEHEWTYKQTEAMPRYHARDVALQLAELSGAVVVLGSATPDVASAHATTRGIHTCLTLPRRIQHSGAPTDMAAVEIVDLREELRQGNRNVFSRALRDALVQTFASGQQALLFLNRRGAANMVECRNCGHVVKCPRCSTPYAFHTPSRVPDGHNRKDVRGILLCHHCNRRRRVPSTCPDCRSPRIRYLGIGTQRLVEEAQALLPDARVLRWDRDTASYTTAHAKLLRSLTSGQVDVLVGTQMISKGLDVPSVALVGVVLADIGLSFPDFRAPERIFQVLTQVAGRAGRGDIPGRVIIQTYQPDNYAIRAAASQDYESFYHQEISFRSLQRNPPFSKLIRFVYGHSNPETARQETMRFSGILRGVLREWDLQGVEIIGPAPTFPPRLRGAWRWHLLVRGTAPRLLLDKVAIPPAWTVDVDPVTVI